jgi:hypothetical protein
VTDKRTPRDLLEDWASAKGSVASEYSSNIAVSYRKIIEEAKVYARDLGIPWDDKIISDDMYEQAETAWDRAEDDYRERGTQGCCVHHTYDSECQTW